jgi:hypothetical protein
VSIDEKVVIEAPIDYLIRLIEKEFEQLEREE